MDTTSEKSAFIHPPALREELEKVVGKIRFDITHLGFMSTDERREQVLAEMKEVDEQWAKIGLYLLAKHPTEVLRFPSISIHTFHHRFCQDLAQTHFTYNPIIARECGYDGLCFYKGCV